VIVLQQGAQLAIRFLRVLDGMMGMHPCGGEKATGMALCQCQGLRGALTTGTRDQHFTDSLGARAV